MNNDTIIQRFNKYNESLGNAKWTIVNQEQCMRFLSRFLNKNFNNASRTYIEGYINTLKSDSTREVYKIYIKKFYKWLSKHELTRVTGLKCPNCDNLLFNTKLDGIFFYCNKCKMQHRMVG